MRSKLSYALALSLLVNIGVLGAVATHAWRVHDPDTTLAEALALDAAQRERWLALESTFLREYDEGSVALATERERLIRAIFSDQPDSQRIEGHRAAIAALQQRQQQRVIEQFLNERAMLDARQRQALAELLLGEAPTISMERGLHQR